MTAETRLPLRPPLPPRRAFAHDGGRVSAADPSPPLVAPSRGESVAPAGRAAWPQPLGRGRKLAVFGATGTLGRLVVEAALADGHAVRAVARRPERGLDAHERLARVPADVLDPTRVAEAVEGADAVICVLGAGRKGGVRAPGTRNILAGMKRHGVRRLICESTLGVGSSEANLNFFWKRIMFGLLLRPAFRDHELQEAAVMASDVDWTIVRPAAFTDGPETGRFRHGFGPEAEGLTLKISRRDVARFLLDQVGSDVHLRATPALSC